MNVLLIGGSGSLINNLIIKLNKEGHRIYLLTGNKYKQEPYQKVFERYDFTYDCGSLTEIFESVNPDLTIYMGAFDTNYRWNEENKESIKYTTGLMNILMAYAMGSEGRFIYLSSDEVYTGHYEQNIQEDEPLTPKGVRSMVLAQGEELCKSYYAYRGRDIVILRLDHIYSIPKERKDVNNICAQMCLEVLEQSTITITEGSRFSLLYETDAVEYMYRLINSKEHKYYIYNLASSVEISELDIAKMVKAAMGWEIEIVTREEEGERRVLSNRLFDSEFGNPFCCEVNAIIDKMVIYMKKHRHAFLTGEEVKQPLWKSFMEASGWFVKAIIPFVENLVCFVPIYFLNMYLAEGSIFSRLDFFLLYVLLFAIVYGQQQATFSAVLSVIGYCMSQMSEHSGLEVMLDSNTYIWIAQIFILGLVVGYMRDQLTKIKSENIEEQQFLSNQLNDIQDINYSNVRVKDALETQIVNQNDSVGKIYSITSALDQYSPQEVLFYAADMLGKLMRSKDVAIYTVSGSEYARLFSYTSVKAKSMGNSIRYRELGELYDTLMERKVYINRKMDEGYPLMANAIFDNDELQLMVFVWGLSWEQMTLGQANQLTIISYLIQNALVRSNKYLTALEEERYVEESRILKTDAFTILSRAYVQAEQRRLTECTLLRILVEEHSYFDVGAKLTLSMRDNDHIGTLGDGKLYVLLANTTKLEAMAVAHRFAEMGYETEIVEDDVAWQNR